MQRISNSQNGTDGEAAGAVLDVLVALWKDLYMVKKGDNPRKKNLQTLLNMQILLAKKETSERWCKKCCMSNVICDVT